MTTPRRPGFAPVALLAFFAAVMVVAFARGEFMVAWFVGLGGSFLTMELWHAIANSGDTFSEDWWSILGIRPRRRHRQVRTALAGVFIGELGLHITLGGAYWFCGGWAIGGTATPLACVVGYSLICERRSAVKIKDKAVRWLAFRWLRGKVADKGGTVAKVLEALKGWKLIIGVVVLFGTALYDQMANGHAGDLVGAVLTILGWMPAIDWQTQIKDAVGPAIILIGLIGKVWAARKQAAAGATAGELLSTKGYVKAAISDVGVTKTLASVGVPAVAKR